MNLSLEADHTDDGIIKQQQALLYDMMERANRRAWPQKNCCRIIVCRLAGRVKPMDAIAASPPPFKAALGAQAHIHKCRATKHVVLLVQDGPSVYAFTARI